MDPDPVAAEAMRRIQRIESLLMAKGIATREELDPTPPEYGFLARLMNAVTEKVDRAPEDPT